jgi:hypothetical protein
MNILVCDDMNDAALKLKKIIAFSVSDVNITVFNAGEEVLAHIRFGRIPDLCFILRDSEMLAKDELAGAKKALNAAAMTYFAGLLTNCASFIRLLLLRKKRR